MENCLGHTIIMATVVLSWSIPPGCVETFSTLYLHAREMSELYFLPVAGSSEVALHKFLLAGYDQTVR